MIRQSADEVIIYERGGVNPVRLAVAQPACSWGLNEAGQFSAFATLNQIQEAGLPSDLKGMWLEWDSPAGAWGGVINGRPVTDGVAEIASLSYATLMRGRVLLQNVRPSVAPAGAIMRAVLQAAVRDEPLFLTIGTIDESGPPLAMAFGAQDLFIDVLPALANESGHEWQVTPDRVFNFGQFVGEDRSHEVRLVEGRHIAGYRAADDLWTMANSLIGMSASAEMETKQWMTEQLEYTLVPGSGHYEAVYKKKRKKKKDGTWHMVDVFVGWNWVVDQAAYYEENTLQVPHTLTTIDPFVTLGFDNTATVAKYGLIESIRSYGDTRDQGTIALRLKAELAAMLNPPLGMELTLIDADDCYRRFAEGDVVWIDIGSASLAGAFRVLNRSYDSGGLRVAGDLRTIGGA